MTFPQKHKWFNGHRKLTTDISMSLCIVLTFTVNWLLYLTSQIGRHTESAREIKQRILMDGFVSHTSKALFCFEWLTWLGYSFCCFTAFNWASLLAILIIICLDFHCGEALNRRTYDNMFEKVSTKLQALYSNRWFCLSTALNTYFFCIFWTKFFHVIIFYNYVSRVP